MKVFLTLKKRLNVQSRPQHELVFSSGVTILESEREASKAGYNAMQPIIIL